MKYTKITIALLSLGLLVGCSLKEYPYGFYSKDNFYKTPADASSAVNYIYDAINYIEYSRSIVFLGDMNTDNLDPKGDAAASNKELDSWNLNNLRTNTTLGNFFKYSYITINRANSVIANMPNMKELDENTRNRFLGEAYFMRGYSYFCLARNFGCVPVHLSPVTTIDDTATSRAESLDQMWKVIIDDFTTAAGLLPLYSKPITGRTDKAAAEGMLAKAYLYIASAKEHGAPKYSEMSFDVEDYYSKAVEAAAWVVDNPEQTTYGFDPDLLDIFDVDNPTGPEHLFLMSMDVSGSSEGQYSKISKMYIPYISGATIYLKQGSGNELVPSHDGWGEYRTSKSLYDSFEQGDLRRDYLIVSEVYDQDGNVTASVANGKIAYPFCRKFIDPHFMGDKTSTKPFLLRYSDVALTYAEAAGPTTKAYELVDYIRSRAGLTPLPAGLSKEDFREAVLKERGYELAFEGNSCYDLRRWNRLHTDITAAREQGYTAEDLVFYPLPSLETDLNPNI